MRNRVRNQGINIDMAQLHRSISSSVGVLSKVLDGEDQSDCIAPDHDAHEFNFDASCIDGIGAIAWMLIDYELSLIHI